MSGVRLHDEPADLESPTLVEGFPGMGLVGKIATDHLIDELGMRYYASVHCEGLPKVGIYHEGDREVRPPLRLYVSEADDLLALQCDVPIASRAVSTVAECLTGWLLESEAFPIYLSGYPADTDETRAMQGIATGKSASRLDELDVDVPSEAGVVSGPTGALLATAAKLDVDAVGLIVESHPQFPDPAAARVLVEKGIAPLADLDVDVTNLIERSEEIKHQRERLAQRMQELGEQESSQARPLRMYQ